MKHLKSIQRLSAVLHEHYGTEIDSIIVFGSVARDSSKVSSDIDVMIVFDRADQSVGWHTEWEVRSIALAVELEEDVVFDLKVVDKAGLSGIRGHTPFMERVRSEGVQV